MIKFLATNVDTKRVILGIIITEDNIIHLKNDQPIHFNVEQMPGLDKIECQEVIIMYYPTMDIAIKKLTELGYLEDDAKVIEETRTRH